MVLYMWYTNCMHELQGSSHDFRLMFNICDGLSAIVNYVVLQSNVNYRREVGTCWLMGHIQKNVVLLLKPCSHAFLFCVLWFVLTISRRVATSCIIVNANTKPGSLCTD